MACLPFTLSDMTHSAEIPSWDVKAVKSAMQPLEFDTGQAYNATVQSYFDYYGISFEGARHNFGTIVAGEFAIAAHVYRPPEPVGTVYLVHGYLDHTGLLARLIGLLLDMDFAVVVFDLPGHGLSSGQQAGIDDFSRYKEVFTEIHERTGHRMPKPHSLVTHSTGCSMALDLIQNGGAESFKRIVMMAPLVRPAFYIWSRVGVEIAGPVIRSVDRRFRINSSDMEFVRFVKNDPLQSRSIPLKWVRALSEWNDRVENYNTRPDDVLIIQGTEDVIVQWEYNMDFLREKLPNARVELIEGANHQLMNESEPFLTRVFDVTKGYLSEGGMNKEQ